MPEPDSENHVERKVVVERSVSSGGNSIAAWVIIGVLAVALIIYILSRIL